MADEYGQSIRTLCIISRLTDLLQNYLHFESWMQMIYLTLFFEFLKIGLFAFGGGFAAIPFLFDMADRYPWFTHEMLVDMIAVSEIAPGPIGIKMATYAGYQAAGIPGSIAAVMGLITPGVVVMILLLRVLKSFNENKYVQNAFWGLRPAVTALIAAAAFDIAGLSMLDFSLLPNMFGVAVKPLVLFIFLWVALQSKLKWFSPFTIIVLAGIVGVTFRL